MWGIFNGGRIVLRTCEPDLIPVALCGTRQEFNVRCRSMKLWESRRGI